MTNDDGLSYNDKLLNHLEEIGTKLGDKLRDIERDPYTGDKLRVWCNQVDDLIERSNENDLKIMMDKCHDDVADYTTDDAKRTRYKDMIIEARKKIRFYKIPLGFNYSETMNLDTERKGCFMRRGNAYYYNKHLLDIDGQSGRLLDAFFNAHDNKLTRTYIENFDDSYGNAYNRTYRLRKALREVADRRDLIKPTNVGNEKGFQLIITSADSQQR